MACYATSQILICQQFNRMEDKANQMLDEANAMSELNKTAA